MEFSYWHEFRSASPAAVHDGIVAWLRKENAKKIAGDGRTVIEASHGSTWALMGCSRDGKKNLTFFIAPKDRGTVVTVKAKPSLSEAGNIARTAEEANSNWGMLLEECWAAIEGVDVTQNMLVLEKTIEERRGAWRIAGRKMVIIGIIGLVAVWAIALGLFWMADLTLPSSFVVVPTVVFALTAIQGFMKMRS